MTPEQLTLLQKSLEKLRSALREGLHLTQNQFDPVAKYVRTAVTRGFGTSSDIFAEIDSALDHGFNYAYEDENTRMRFEAFERAIVEIETAIDLDKEFGPPPIAGANQAVSPRTSQDLGKVFLVHGHDQLTLRNVESFVRQRGLHPIILKDEPNLGRTLVEKLEAHSDVAYAVVIMSADDEGHARGQGAMRPRARQNVVLELGYFAALLQRKNIAVLFEPGVEMPSDFDGVAYIELDAGEGWHFKLVKELKAAGLQVSI